ncbi:MAG: type II toxin-antitoxin system RelE family toxin [Dehalococcoidia bacterium]
MTQRDRNAVLQALDRLAADFGSADVKKLSSGHSAWRLRVGRWRVILDLDNKTGAINVTRVLPRDSAYHD